MEKNSDITAVFTLYSKSTCGYCHQFKGEVKNDNGTVTINPTSDWEKLKKDKSLYDAGIEFVLYQFGPEVDKTTGQTVNYILPPNLASKIRGVPYLELRLPNDTDGGVQYDGASRSFETVKTWILQKLKSEPFRSGANAARPSVVHAPSKQEIEAQDKSALRAQQNIPMRTARTAAPQQPRAEQGQQYQYQPPVPQAQQSRQPSRQEQQQQQHQQQQHQQQYQHRQAVAQGHESDGEETDESDEQPQVQQSRRNAPTTFGLGTQAVSVPAEKGSVITKSTRFMPVNY